MHHLFQIQCLELSGLRFVPGTFPDEVCDILSGSGFDFDADDDWRTNWTIKS